MKPSQVAIALRRIASAIQASKNPDKNLVARDLKKIISKIAEGPIDWADIENTLFNALNNSDSVESEVFDEISGLDNLNQQYGLVFSQVIDLDQNIGIQVSYEGDFDLVWFGPISSFDKTAKAKAASDAILSAQNFSSFLEEDLLQ